MTNEEQQHEESAAFESQSLHESDAVNDAQSSIDSDAIDAAIAGELETMPPAEGELAEAKDAAIRAQAELDNFRKRARRELEESLRYAQLPVLRDMLVVLDNLGLAINAAGQNEAAAEVVAGVQMVNEQLLGVLNTHHCKPIASVGQPFDPNQHEAVQMEASDEYPANVVSRELRSGFMLHDRVVRPAQVFVSTGPGPATE